MAGLASDHCADWRGGVYDASLAAISAALTVGLHRGTALLSLLILPLAMPILIFGARTVSLVAAGDGVAGGLYIKEMIWPQKNIRDVNWFLIMIKTFALFAFFAAKDEQPGTAEPYPGLQLQLSND